MLKVNEGARKKFCEAMAFARKIGEFENFKQMIQYLHNYAGKEKTVCELYTDFAPHSFQFSMQRKREGGRLDMWFNGGMIYHGPLDNKGNCAEPFTVQLAPNDGWSLHT